MTTSAEADGVLDQSRLESGRFGFEGASGAAAKADDHVDPAVVQVERLGAALVAVAEDRDALAGERRGIDVGVAKHLHARPPRRSPSSSASASPSAVGSSGSRNRGHSARRLVREPGVLPLGVTARRLLARGDRLFERDFAAQIGRDFAHPDRRASPAGRDRACERAASSLPRPRLLDHLREPLVAAARRAIRAAAAGSAGEARRLSPIPPSRCSLPFARACARSTSTTSSARAIRAVSAGLSRAAASGSSSASLRAILLDRRFANRAAGPRDRSAAPARSRRAGCGGKGRSRRPGSATVPAHGCPRSRAAPARAQSAAEQGDGAVEDAVEPMLGPRELVRRRRRAQHRQIAIDLRAVGIDDHAVRFASASASASADLPLAVGPAIRATGGLGFGHGHCDADSSGTAR